MQNQTQQTVANVAGGKERRGVFARIKQLFSRNKNQPNQPAKVRKGLLTHGASGATKALGSTHGALTRVNQVAVYGGLLAGAFGALSKLPGLGRYFSKVENAAQKPGEFMENTSLQDASHAGSRLLSRAQAMAQGRSGERAQTLARKLGDAQEGLHGLENQTGQTLKRKAESISQPLGEFMETKAGGVLSTLSEKAGKGAGKHFGSAEERLETALSLTAGNRALEGVGSALETAKSALGKEGKDPETASEALSKAAEALKKLPKGKVDRQTAKELQKGVQKAGESLGTAAQRQGMADKLSSLPGAVKAAPNTLASANLSSVALKGAAVTGTALQVASTAKGVGEKVHALKQMHCDLTGAKKISTRKLLFSRKVPDVVKEVRGHIFKEYGPRVVLNFANTIATYTFMKNTNLKSMAGSFGLMAASSIHAAKVEDYALLPVYQQLSHMQNIQPEQYAAFITMASKEAREEGGIEAPAVQAVAMDYAQSGGRPSEVLQDMQTGALSQKIQQRQQEYAALAEQQALAAQPVRPGAQQGPVGTGESHAGRLQNVNTHRVQTGMDQDTPGR